MYHSNNYYQNDIYSVTHGHFGEFVLWSSLNCSGASSTFVKDAGNLGYHQFFTIIEKDVTGTNFYHFATGIATTSMSQMYLSNIDALKAFIRYFKNTAETAKELSSWCDIKFKIENNHADIELPSDQMIISNDVNRNEFFNEIGVENKFSQLSPQQLKCFSLLVKGACIKQIASELNLTYRTVEHYLGHTRAKLKCRSTKELIARYASQIN